MKTMECAIWRRRLGLLAAVAAMAVWGAGCEDDDEFDHDPPAGLGALVVDNQTGDRVRVYFDGLRVESVGKGDDRAYDLEPGVYRVALDGEDTDRFWTEDVDVLEGRLTILRVNDDYGDLDDFDVDVDVD